MLVIRILFLFTFSSLLGSENLSSWQGYESVEGAYNISLPVDWVIQPTGDAGEDVEAISPASSEEDRHFENVAIYLEPLERPYEPEEYLQLSLENLQRHADAFSVLSSGEESISGRSVRWFRAKVRVGKVVGEVMQYQLVEESRVYVIECTAEPSQFASYEPIFKQIVSSFQLDPSEKKSALADASLVIRS